MAKTAGLTPRQIRHDVRRLRSEAWGLSIPTLAGVDLLLAEARWKHGAYTAAVEQAYQQTRARCAALTARLQAYQKAALCGPRLLLNALTIDRRKRTPPPQLCASSLTTGTPRVSPRTRPA